MHPALRSWRDELPAALVRILAYLGAAALLAMAAAWIFQSSAVLGALTPSPRGAWIDIRKPFPAFALNIPESAGAPTGYAIQRNVAGGGRKDILSLGDPDGADPYLRVVIYRAGGEIGHFDAPGIALAADTQALGPVEMRSEASLQSKFGPLTILAFDTSKGTPRHCLGFVRSFGDPRLQISGSFCRGGEFIARSTLACALDRLTLLSAGSDPKIGALFAHAELRRQDCGERDPILAPTPKYRTLWKALQNRPLPRRVGR